MQASNETQFELVVSAKTKAQEALKLLEAFELNQAKLLSSTFEHSSNKRQRLLETKQDPFDAIKNYLTFCLTYHRRPNISSNINDENKLAEDFETLDDNCTELINTFFSSLPSLISQDTVNQLILFYKKFGRYPNKIMWPKDSEQIEEDLLAQNTYSLISTISALDQGKKLLDAALEFLSFKGPTYNTASLFFANDMLRCQYNSIFENNSVSPFVASAKLDQPDTGYKNTQVPYEKIFYCYYNDNVHIHTIQKMFQSFGLDMKALAAVLYDAKAVIAGGFALNCLVEFCEPSKFDGDLDIFVCSKDQCNRVNDKIPAIHNYLQSYGYDLVKTSVADHNTNHVYGDLANIEQICIFKRIDDGRKVQVIVVKTPTAIGYVRSFDISVCQTALFPESINSFLLSTRSLYYKLTTRGIMKLLKPGSYDTDLGYVKRICKYMSRGFIPLLDSSPNVSSFSFQAHANHEESLSYLENLLQVLQFHTRINANFNTFLSTLTSKIMYVMGSIVIVYCKASNPSNNFKHKYIELFNRFVSSLKGKKVQHELQVLFTRRILTVSNIRWLLLAMNSHLDIFWFHQTEKTIASQASLSRDVTAFVNKLVEVCNNSKKDQEPMKLDQCVVADS